MTSVTDIIEGAVSLIVGMGVTIKAFFSPVVTVQYPRQTINITPRFRGHTKLVADDEKPERTKCIVCGMCERNCPSKSISGSQAKKWRARKKRPPQSTFSILPLAANAGYVLRHALWVPLPFRRTIILWDTIGKISILTLLKNMRRGKRHNAIC